MYRKHFAHRASKELDTSLKDVLVTFPGAISFSGGLPDEDAFEMDAIQRVMGRVSASPDAWQYIETEGFPPLRETLAKHMQSMGVESGPENILITSGSQQALDLVAKLLIDPGDQVLVEAPGYLGGLKAFENYEAKLVGVPLENDGIDINALKEIVSRVPHPKFIYTVSTFQNPAGCTLSKSKRRELLDIAEQRDFLIIEDGAYQHLRYDGEHVDPIKSIDSNERVIYLGSLSKVLVPGIRVGWIAANEHIIERLALLKQATDLAGNTFGQVFADTWLREEGLRPPVALYKEKRDVAYNALREHMPSNLRFQRAEGGFFFWIQLPEKVDAGLLLPIARREGVTFVPGAAFGGKPNTLRLSYSQVALDDIEEGVVRLTRAINRQLNEQEITP